MSEVAWLTRGQSADFSSQFVPDLALASSRLQSLTTGRGSDLPTMVSRIRLIWTIALTAHVLRTGLRGDVVETGVWAGGSTIAMLSMMQQHNASSPSMCPRDSNPRAVAEPQPARTARCQTLQA